MYTDLFSFKAGIFLEVFLVSHIKKDKPIVFGLVFLAVATENLFVSFW